MGHLPRRRSPERHRPPTPSPSPLSPMSPAPLPDTPPPSPRSTPEPSRSPSPSPRRAPHPGIGGSVSALANNPIDVVKSRIQSGAHRGSILSCLRVLYNERGLMAFCAGAQARCLRLFASQAIQFTIVDHVVRLLRR